MILKGPVQLPVKNNGIFLSGIVNYYGIILCYVQMSIVSTGNCSNYQNVCHLACCKQLANQSSLHPSSIE